MNAKKLALAAMAIAATVAAASVEARTRDDVQLSVTIGGPAWSVPSVPVYRAYGPAFARNRRCQAWNGQAHRSQEQS